MKLNPSLLILYFLILGCNNGDKKREINIPPPFVSTDTSDGKQFIALLKPDIEFKSIELTKEDLKFIDDLLNEVISKYNSDLRESMENGKEDELFINLRYYKRQYIAYRNKNGDREVWINCFCQNHDNDDWKNKIQDVNDGGNCYFNLKIDLTNKRYFDFSVNGLA